MSNELLNDYFDAGYAFDVQTFYKNSIFEAFSGREQRFNHSTNDRKIYSVRTTARTDSERKAIVAFFDRHKSNFDDFLYKDPSDNFISRVTIGTGDGIETAFQLVDATGNAKKNIELAPVDARIWINGVLQAKGVGYGLVYVDSGIVTTAAPVPGAHIIEAEFYYYRRIRLQEDVFGYTVRVFNDNSLGFLFKEVVV